MCVFEFPISLTLSSSGWHCGTLLSGLSSLTMLMKMLSWRSSSLVLHRDSGWDCRQTERDSDVKQANVTEIQHNICSDLFSQRSSKCFMDIHFAITHSMYIYSVSMIMYNLLHVTKWTQMKSLFKNQANQKHQQHIQMKHMHEFMKLKLQHTTTLWC